jgi:hypothetical protein
MKLVDEYILRQSNEFREILFYIIAVIEQEVSDAELLYKYKIPFFYIKGKPFIYLNCNVKKKYVDVGFFYGNQLMNHNAILISENRTLVKSLRYYNLNSVEDAILREIITEANNFKKLTQ